AEQAEEKLRLTRLLAEREKLRQESEAVLEQEQRKSEILAAQASNLEELIQALERRIEERRREEEERRRREEELEDLPVPPANRLTAPKPSGELRTRLVLPASGRFLSRFGSEDQLGGKRSGDTLQTQSGAIATTPCDATVLYSGPFRSYGQLLI